MTNIPDASKNGNDSEDEGEDKSLMHMPDTSILFQRYLESGRMINVYDWFESFAVILEAQKRHKKSTGQPSRDESSSIPRTPRTPRTPRMPSRYGRSNKTRQQNADDDEEGEAPQDEEREEAEEGQSWRLEAQARFIRALHELDYVGFIKHTGRKRDHVQRTVLDAPTL